MSYYAQSWFRSSRRQRQVSDRTFWEAKQTRMASVRTGRRDWSDRGGNVDQAIARESGGCFLPAESGNRGDKGVMASLAYLPEVAEEEVRLQAGDRLRNFVSIEDLEAGERMDVEVIEESDGEISLQAVDPRVGPRFIPLLIPVDDALFQVMRSSPKYLVKAYEMAKANLRLDVMSRLPFITEQLVGEGVYSLERFQQTKNGNGFSVYQTFKGYAAAERSFSGREGIACRILDIVRGH
jgi:hypothetical protein